jgi:hypothetical protein
MISLEEIGRLSIISIALGILRTDDAFSNGEQNLRLPRIYRSHRTQYTHGRYSFVTDREGTRNNEMLPFIDYSFTTISLFGVL